MKKLLVLFVLSISIVSCGKSDNNVNGGSYSYSNPYITDGTQSQYLNDLTHLINSNSFGHGIIATHGISWNQAIAQYPNGKFNYVLTSSGSSQSNCKTKWSIFYYCTSTSGNIGSGNSVVPSRQVFVNQVNHDTKRQELMNIVNQAISAGVNADRSVYYIQTQSGYYAIDTRYPLIANPSGVQSGYQLEYLYNFTQY